MIIDGIWFNVAYWKNKKEKDFLDACSSAYPDKDLKSIFKALKQETGELPTPTRLTQYNGEN